jgi:FKBP-type peptidyl-prolyl cis-trans isomerase (trigger factor)
VVRDDISRGGLKRLAILRKTTRTRAKARFAKKVSELQIEFRKARSIGDTVFEGARRKGFDRTQAGGAFNPGFEISSSVPKRATIAHPFRAVPRELRRCQTAGKDAQFDGGKAVKRAERIAMDDALAKNLRRGRIACSNETQTTSFSRASCNGNTRALPHASEAAHA